MRRTAVALLLAGIIASALVPAAVWKLSIFWRGKVEVRPEGRQIRVLDVSAGKVDEIPLERYIIGVVAAEMPASYNLEALKAQAVAARTYILRRLSFAESPANSHYPLADTCTDPTHCQGFLTEEEMKGRWGIFYAYYRKKIAQAVAETEGLVIVYRGELTDPVYHGNAGGRTEDAREVWGYPVPYLKSVPSPWDEGGFRYREEVALSLEEIDARLGTSLAEIPVSGGQKGALLKIGSYTPSGRAKSVLVGGKEFSGPEFRRLLGLSSTKFTWRYEEGKIVFQTTGYGHGVGMSQSGANGMAAQGKNFREILGHYYPGTEVQKWPY